MVKRIVALVSMMTLQTFSAHADCSSAISSYNSAIGDIETYSRRYMRCVADSRGTDDCSSEFRRLRNAQGDFESAVSSYQSYCRR